MSKIYTTAILGYNCMVVSLLVSIGILAQPSQQRGSLLLLLPVGVYFFLVLVYGLLDEPHQKKFQFLKPPPVLGIVSGVVVVLLILATLNASTTFADLGAGILFLPLVLPFWWAGKQAWYQRVPAVVQPNVVEEGLSTAVGGSLVDEEALTVVDDADYDVQDSSRRQFLKLLGGGGVSFFFMLIFMPHKAEAAFFGSTPGPGIVGIKDSTGQKIDPAEKKPTDGFTITEIDDDTSPSYYGFVNKNGYWYIAKEDSSGSYRYTTGTSNFTVNWTNRAGLSYDYFNVVF